MGASCCRARSWRPARHQDVRDPPKDSVCHGISCLFLRDSAGLASVTALRKACMRSTQTSFAGKVHFQIRKQAYRIVRFRLIYERFARDFDVPLSFPEHNFIFTLAEL